MSLNMMDLPPLRPNYQRHRIGPMHFLPLGNGVAQMIKGTWATWCQWRPIKWLGQNSGFYQTKRMWHLSIRGRRVL